MPVAFEQGQKKSGWVPSVQLDTSVMLPFVNALKASPNADIAPKEMRTVSIVHITDHIDIYVLPILPILKRDEKCWFYWVNSKEKTKNNSFPKNWMFYMTPEIRRALAAQMRQY